ncbi:hypothetical protein AA310_12130 [Arthrobacter sp. YC-RL1]|uniref:DUF4190 domain-containing protein n=1 Tax=Glutamicibacter soli TaxID=453836 RepID=A0A6L9G652_9MICC|nr:MULTISPECIES: DUF4190 domain-containing protein [Micrococcaceae]ALD64574.1 hypothetical protein AFL94_12320 [Arthrobacter sp. LS16]ALQ30136.1 hypothetical protein ATC04_05890 [Arthrobacter sp. YC-RL1]KLI88540.1 hypothetical protein AA310_12130 [Arthrobacter sp. YC-RL1]NAZ16617.1 DUF4190 domain-containing protein [Glutamicibacter soli]RKS22244.1 uncharacterized protein DUF4190 [Arthrobacter sp. AG1021]
MDKRNGTQASASLRVNRLSIIALCLAIAEIPALIFLGGTGPAVFAVGAGHVALNQIKTRNEQGAKAAILALALGYAVALFGVFSTLRALPYIFA